MPKSEKQKQKLLYIIKMLQEKSDESHPIKMEAILEMLDHEGIKAERKSIYNDMDTLRDFGYDIMLTKGKNGGYFLAYRDFDVAELKVLVDAVQASRFITTKKSKDLIRKITTLAGEHEAKNLKREVYVMNRIKSENEAIYYNVDEIHRAIEANKQITFKYLEYSVNKEAVPRRNGKTYKVSPRALAWNEEKYYLIAYDADADLIKNYRVDKIKDIDLTDESRIILEKDRNFDVAEYCNRAFGMYCGDDETITVRFPNRLIGVVIDRFGKEVNIYNIEGECFKTRLNVSVSPQLFGWITGLGPEVQIVGPSKVVDEYKDFMNQILNNYNS